MDYSEMQKYVGSQVVLKDWYRILTKPGTRGRVTAVVKTHHGDIYLSVRLQDKVRSEELFTPDAFGQVFQVIGATKQRRLVATSASGC